MMAMDGYRVGAPVDTLPLYRSYLKNYSSSIFDMSTGQSGRENFSANDDTFHTPSFGDEEFDLLPIGRPPNNNSLPPQTVSQTPYTQQTMNNLDHNQPMTVASNMETRCSSTTLSGPPSLAPIFPPQNFDVPDISVTNSVMPSASNSDNLFSRMGSMFPGINSQPFTEPAEPLSTISRSQMTSQLGFQSSVVQQSSPAGSNSTTSPTRESTSEDSDDSLPLAQLMSLKRSAAASNSDMPELTPVPTPTSVKITAVSAKKQKTPKKKKKKDPNEPQKPVSAYALFFRDTQAAIKGQNPSASFGEVSKIVASMWDGLDPDHKNVYKKKTEVAKKEYLKQLAAYRASQVSQTVMEEPVTEKSPSPPNIMNSAIPNLQPVNNMGMMANMGNIQSQAQRVMMPDYGNQSSPQMLQNIGHHQPMGVHQTNNMNFHDQSLNQDMHPNSLMGMSRCQRSGCTNQAIENPGWDNEYCSNECVVHHCRDIFTAWVSSRGGGSAFPVK
ncbi:thymocyte selection-associated high mobility group box protein TOX-like isoform X2 [Gigantopelta aegis]|uniref:thymocyte selection-associated high mobility group box protein TOX-like isoform X2 n=1 Tax=Gigantopelta aegis TaxID=1735272 RepID=UPI001B88AAE0|nr:thymocyte selection-associated high mobility group box protein TOX-like isoform X2 [Gigantopelta aegis]